MAKIKFDEDDRGNPIVYMIRCFDPNTFREYIYMSPKGQGGCVFASLATVQRIEKTLKKQGTLMTWEAMKVFE